MQINSNITAIITNNALLRNESAFKLSTGKLSSGYKINTAGDDPTGYAISGRMRQQLDALKRADVNATTGKSVLETADGALSEVTEMIQRLNELAIKSSNGTMSASDRTSIQNEVDQLTEEIARISDQIELNGQKLLDGHLENHGYCETNRFIHVEEYNDKVNPGTLNKVSVKEEVVTTTVDGNTSAKLKVTVTGFPKDTSAAIDMEFDYPAYLDEEKKESGKDGEAVAIGLYDKSTKGSVKICDDGVSCSQYITVNGPNGEQMTLFIEMDDTKGVSRDGDADYISNGKAFNLKKYKINTGEQTVTITGKGAMDLHVGANEEEIITCSLPKISLARLDLDNLDMSTMASSRASIDRVTNALSYVSKARSSIGAYTNRVEHSINYIAASNENLTSAMSRIQDTDMAEEMTNYASQQVLVQAATSMLAQANQAPQQALQLIQ